MLPVFVLLITLVVGTSGHGGNAWLKGTDVKTDKTPIVSLEDKSLLRCHLLCWQQPYSTAFNYNEATRSCELLKIFDETVLTPSPGWKTYTLSTKEKTPCTEGSAFITFDLLTEVPNRPTRADENLAPDKNRFICSTNAWINAKYSQGKTDCSFTPYVHFDMAGKDIYNAYMKYWEIFPKCEEDPLCYSVLCVIRGDANSDTERCHTKSTSSVYDPANAIMTYLQNIVYWTYDCV